MVRFKSIATAQLGDYSILFEEVRSSNHIVNEVAPFRYRNFSVILWSATIALVAYGGLCNPVTAHPWFGLLVQPDGTLLVLDVIDQRLVRISQDNKCTTWVNANSETWFRDPHDIACSPSGKVYLATYAGVLWEIDTKGVRRQVFPKVNQTTSDKFQFGNGIAFRKQAIYTIDSARKDQHRLCRISLVNSPTVTIVCKLQHGYGRDVAFHDGKIYVGDGSTVLEVKDDGTVKTFVATDAGLKYPAGLCFDQNGVLHIADPIANAIFRRQADGSLERVNYPFALDQPTSVSFGKDGSTYVLDQWDRSDRKPDFRVPRVRKVARDGSVRTMIK